MKSKYEQFLEKYEPKELEWLNTLSLEEIREVYEQERQEIIKKFAELKEDGTIKTKNVEGEEKSIIVIWKDNGEQAFIEANTALLKAEIELEPYSISASVLEAAYVDAKDEKNNDKLNAELGEIAYLIPEFII